MSFFQTTVRTPFMTYTTIHEPLPEGTDEQAMLEQAKAGVLAVVQGHGSLTLQVAPSSYVIIPMDLLQMSTVQVELVADIYHM